MIYQALELITAFDTTYTSMGMLDIETTGLFKQNDIILLISLLEPNQDSFLHHFWLCESPADEKDLLNGFLNHLLDSHKLYTYGGTTFDLAFVASRCEKYGLDLTVFRSLLKVDFKKLPFFKSIFPHTVLKRADLEALVGFKRCSTTGGRELAKLATIYLNTPHPTYKEIIFSHNKDDLLSLLHFFYFYEILKSIHPNQLLESLVAGYTMHYTFKTISTYPSDFSFTVGSYKISYQARQYTLSVTLDAQYLLLNHYLPHKDYYIVNGELMHKSLAQFIPSDMKQKATRATAYIEKEDYYVPAPLTEHSWLDTFKNSYIPLSQASSLESLLIKDLSRKITRGLIN